jgi:hypothetical protein
MITTKIKNPITIIRAFILSKIGSNTLISVNELILLFP